MTENALPLPNPSYDQSNKQQGAAIEYCWETSKSVERLSQRKTQREDGNLRVEKRLRKTLWQADPYPQHMATPEEFEVCRAYG